MLLRDAAYSGLPFRLRRRMHAHAGETASRLDLTAPSRTCLRAAVDALLRRRRHGTGMDVLANGRPPCSGTVRLTRRLSSSTAGPVESGPVSRRVRDEDIAEVLEVHGRMSDELAGFSSEAVEAFRSARRHRRQHDPPRRATLLLKEAGCISGLGAFTMSLRVLTQGSQPVARRRGRRASRATRSRLATSYAFSQIPAGRPQDRAALERHRARGGARRRRPRSPRQGVQRSAHRVSCTPASPRRNRTASWPWQRSATWVTCRCRGSVSTTWRSGPCTTATGRGRRSSLGRAPPVSLPSDRGHRGRGERAVQPRRLADPATPVRRGRAAARVGLPSRRGSG